MKTAKTTKTIRMIARNIIAISEWTLSDEAFEKAFGRSRIATIQIWAKEILTELEPDSKTD